ncbi:MAG: SRPBCC family protein [bacterium]|nr:SRPBCC family protein [bacterium]
MVEFSMEREFAISADDLWAMLADFGDISWIPGLEKVELEGEGVGMIRHVTAPGMPMLHERMDAIDHETMTLDYSVPAVAYLQVIDYTARAQVTPLGEGRCRVNWSCRSQADGIDEAQATANTAGFYEMIMSWIADRFSK